MSQSEHREAGLTLIEVIAAIALLGLVAVGIATMLIASGLAAERVQQIASRPFMSSANYTEYKLAEETAAAGPPQTLTTPYGGIPAHPEFSRVVTLTYNSPVSGMLRVQATVSWVDRQQGTKSHVIVTYLHPRLEESS
jgi:prepilin-type N-terminal cleavage/methylation domain-containing protein